MERWIKDTRRWRNKLIVGAFSFILRSFSKQDTLILWQLFWPEIINTCVTNQQRGGGQIKMIGNTLKRQNGCSDPGLVLFLIVPVIMIFMNVYSVRHPHYEERSDTGTVLLIWSSSLRHILYRAPPPGAHESAQWKRIGEVVGVTLLSATMCEGDKSGYFFSHPFLRCRLCFHRTRHQNTGSLVVLFSQFPGECQTRSSFTNRQKRAACIKLQHVHWFCL